MISLEVELNHFLTLLTFTHFFIFFIVQSMLLYTNPTSLEYDSKICFPKSNSNACIISFSYFFIVLFSFFKFFILSSTLIVFLSSKYFFCIFKIFSCFFLMVFNFIKFIYSLHLHLCFFLPLSDLFQQLKYLCIYSYYTSQFLLTSILTFNLIICKPYYNI